MATPPTYVTSPLSLACEAGGDSTGWIVTLKVTHVETFELEWVPGLRATDQFDADWDWRDELLQSASDPESELYALVAAVAAADRPPTEPSSKPPDAPSNEPTGEPLSAEPPCDQRLHGLCGLRQGRVSKLTAGALVTYLDRLAVAPWNRVEAKPNRELLCGRAMMVHVIQRSIAAGFEGRVGLHSVEDQHTHLVYRHWGMTECGRDPNVCGDDGQPELYFEFSADDAYRFLTRIT